MARTLIVANWKMNKTVKESISFIVALKNLVKKMKNTEIVVCAPFSSLSEIKKLIKNTNIKLGAQNMHFEEKGAYTGEISPLMLKDIGCDYVIVGHSDRREYFKEDDSFINKKVIAALNHSLTPILCIGENSEQRNDGKTNRVLESQMKICLKNINKNQILKVVIAYEPIWAISRGNPNHKAATAEDAEQGHKFIRETIEKLYDKKTAGDIRIIYGGSMKPENAKELLAKPDIDGGLVGNASLDAGSFAQIIKLAIKN
jgi:triosephosphate isomerase (TIM)